MLEKELDTQASGNKWWSKKDARMKSYAYSTTYSEQQKIAAERVKLGLELCYANKDIHINFRKKFITIKVEKPLVRDRKNLKLLEAEYEDRGYKKCVSAQGIIYRIPRD
jgi:hypothetical protein